MIYQKQTHRTRENQRENQRKRENQRENQRTRRNQSMPNDNNALTNPQQGGGAVTDAEAFDAVDAKHGWGGGNYDKLTLPTVEGGKFVYKERGTKVDFVAFKLATAYWKRFYNVQGIAVCFSNNAKLEKGQRLGKDGTTRQEVECNECQFNKQPKTCKPSYVLEWDEGDDPENIVRVRMYLSYSAQKEFGVYSQKLQEAGMDVRNVTTIMKSKKGSSDVPGKGITEYFFATFEMQDAKAGMSLIYNSLSPENQAKVGDYMKKAFNVETVDKLNDIQRDMLTQEMQKLAKDSAPKPGAKKTPF
jgi:hypothetical protein